MLLNCLFFFPFPFGCVTKPNTQNACLDMHKASVRGPWSSADCVDIVSGINALSFLHLEAPDQIQKGSKCNHF